MDKSMPEIVEHYKGFEVYPAEDGHWRWRRRDANGRIIANGGEAFDSKSNVHRSIDNVVEEIAGGDPSAS